MKNNGIYGFKGGNVTYFTNLIKNPKWKTYYLNNNYRSGQNIIELATKVIAQSDDVINLQSNCMSGNVGNVKIDSKYKIDNYLKDIKNYNNRRKNSVNSNSYYTNCSGIRINII